ncbi:UNVERIFIED_CONTAM: hypothetical protein K2H54_048810 [Gekko kuhli]
MGASRCPFGRQASQLAVVPCLPIRPSICLPIPELPADDEEECLPGAGQERLSGSLQGPGLKPQETVDHWIIVSRRAIHTIACTS